MVVIILWSFWWFSTISSSPWLLHLDHLHSSSLPRSPAVRDKLISMDEKWERWLDDHGVDYDKFGWSTMCQAGGHLSPQETLDRLDSTNSMFCLRQIVRAKQHDIWIHKVNRCLARYSPCHNHQPTHQQGTKWASNGQKCQFRAKFGRFKAKNPFFYWRNQKFCYPHNGKPT